jgi:acyl-CoA hydrolase
MRTKKTKSKKSEVTTKPHRHEPVLMTELVLPSHTNDLGTIFGGTVMAWIDIAGAIAARRYARTPVVTLCIDYLQFIVPIKIGYVVRTHADITYVGRTSMEVEVIVEAENPSTGEVRKATQAYLTYVAVDEFGRPKPVSPYTPVTAEEKRKFKEGEERRKRRLML